MHVPAGKLDDTEDGADEDPDARHAHHVEDDAPVVDRFPREELEAAGVLGAPGGRELRAAGRGVSALEIEGKRVGLAFASRRQPARR